MSDDADAPPTAPALAGLSAADAEWFDALAAEKRAAAAAAADPVWAAQLQAEAAGMEALAATLRDPAARGLPALHLGRGGETAPLPHGDMSGRCRDVAAAVASPPSLLQAEATLDRLSLARDADVLTLAVEMAEDATAREKAVAHELAAAHRLTMARKHGRHSAEAVAAARLRGEARRMVASLRALLREPSQIEGEKQGGVPELHDEAVAPPSAPEADAVAAAVLAVAAARGSWSGTASALLAEINQRTPAERHGQGWPPDSTRLSGRLRRAAPALRLAGVKVVLPETGGRAGRVIRLARGGASVPGAPGGAGVASVPAAAPPGKGGGGALSGGSRAAERHGVGAASDHLDVEQEWNLRLALAAAAHGW